VRFGLFLLVTAIFAPAIFGCGARSPVPADVQKLREPAVATVSSNVLRGDYVGSAACNPCHGDVVAAWQRSPMHRMTRLPEETEIHAPFDGREFRFKDDVARFEQVKGARFMRLVSAANGEHVYRVTKVIGGRYREDFAGVEVASADPAAPFVGDPRAELILPASYVFQTASFRLKGYSVMVGERPGLRAGGVWNQACIFCHNTVPYFDDLWSALHGPGAPSYQGEVVDRVLPVGRRLRYVVTDPAALTRAIDEEVAVLGAPPPAAESGVVTPGTTVREATRAALRRAMLESRARFQPSHFVELGIGCEACHGGSREHVDDPGRHPTFEPRAPFMAVAPPTGGDGVISRAEWQNRACARCHQVLFSRYPRTWEGGSRFTPGQAGGSHITSGEARDFLLGSCARAMTCTTCHDPHGEDRPEILARLATPAGNGACTGCHKKFTTAVALQAHAHHDPKGAGASCIACHMPKKNMGLGYALTRYHRIGSPTDVVRVEGDRPLECALCHADKTVAMVLDDMARLWGKHYDRTTLLRLYGALDANVLVATIERGYAHEQAAAMGAAGEQRFAPASAAVAREIDDNAYPLVRYYAATALVAIEGSPTPARKQALGVPDARSGSGHPSHGPSPCVVGGAP
jgi:predicted CXXCH cytochrome family protein